MEDEETTQRKVSATAGDISLCLLFSLSLVTVTSVCLAIAILLNPTFKQGDVVVPTACPTHKPDKCPTLGTENATENVTKAAEPKVSPKKKKRNARNGEKSRNQPQLQNRSRIKHDD